MTDPSEAERAAIPTSNERASLAPTGQALGRLVATSSGYYYVLAVTVLSLLGISTLTWWGLGLPLGAGAFKSGRVQRVAAFFCSVAPVLLCSYVALLIRAQDDRQNLRLYAPTTLDANTRKCLHESWLREQDRVSRARRELVLYAMALGILASALLQVALVTYVTVPVATDCDIPSIGKRVAAAAATAVAVAFSVSFGNILVRSARGDATGRTLALACRCVTFGALIAVLSAAILADADVSTSIPQALLTGVVCSFLGEPLVETVFQAITIVFGASTGGDDNLDKFDLVDGLDEVERLRLNDLGVTSLQSLAFASTPFLYFFTRYGLQRICDWQDQALLLILVGQNADGRAWLQFFRGASKVRELRDKLRPADISALEMDRAEDVVALMDRIASEPQIRHIQSWRECTPLLGKTLSVKDPPPPREAVPGPGDIVT